MTRFGAPSETQSAGGSYPTYQTPSQGSSDALGAGSFTDGDTGTAGEWDATEYVDLNHPDPFDGVRIYIPSGEDGDGVYDVFAGSNSNTGDLLASISSPVVGGWTATTLSTPADKVHVVNSGSIEQVAELEVNVPYLLPHTHSL